MARQIATVMQKSEGDFDELFVSSDKFDERLRTVSDIIAHRAFQIFESRGCGHGHDWDDWYQAESAVLQAVNHEVSDSGDAFLAVVDINSYRPQNLRLSAEPHRLRIVGCPAPAPNGSGTPDNITPRPRPFLLGYQFPAPIDPAKVSAQIRGDLLEVRLPKLSPATSTPL
jgi:HSP20 family molecular chaperone IbpA